MSSYSVSRARSANPASDPDPDPLKKVAKEDLIDAIIEDRPRMLAELLIRLQNIIRAHAIHTGGTFPYASQMTEYERFTSICAAYEGSMEETQSTWASYVHRAGQAVTESNPIVFAVRVWLGKGGNAQRRVSPATLFMEIQSLYLQVQQTLPYKSPAAFGKNLAKNKVPLKAIGLEEIRTRSGREYVFHPTPEEAEHCSKLLCDLSTVVSKRPRGFFDLPSPLSDKGPTEKAAEKLAVEFFDDMSDFEGAA